MSDSGSPSRAIVMRSGADSEMTSGIAGPDVDVIRQAPGLRRDGDTALASAALYVIIDVPKRSTSTRSNVPMRGIRPMTPAVRDEVSFREGRRFAFAANESVVGRGAAANFAGLSVGDELRSGQNTWKVVGMFEADGGVAETEIWCDARVLQGVYRRGNTYQVVVGRLESADSLTRFEDWLTSNPQLNVQVERE